MFQEFRGSRDLEEVRLDFTGFAGFTRGLAGSRGVRGDLEGGFATLRATRRDLAGVSEDSGGFWEILEDPAEFRRILGNVSGISGFAGFRRGLAGFRRIRGI